MNYKSIIIVFIVALFSSCVGNGNGEPDLKLIPVVLSGEYWGYINHDGKYVINPQFIDAYPFYSGVALVQAQDGKFGYIDKDGKYVINPMYVQASDFVDGLALVAKKDSKIEIINTKGETKAILNESIEEANKFSEGLSRILIGNKYGYINTDGKIVIPATFAYAKNFKDGLASVGDGVGGDLYTSIGGKKSSFGFINKKGKLVINYRFESASNFSEGLAIASNGSKYGYIGTDGKFKINPQFDAVSQFSGGLATFLQGKLWGYINEKGEIVINPQFKEAGLFYENHLAPAISANGKCGFIDRDGKYSINPQFDDGTRFYGDIAFIYSDNKFGIIDNKGKIIVQPQFHNIGIPLYKISSRVESEYFNVHTITDTLAKLITQNSVDGMNFETPVATVVTKYQMGKENFNEYKNELDRFDLTLTEKENISNSAFLVFEIEVNNYDRNPIINKFRYRIDLKPKFWSKLNTVISALETAFSGYTKDKTNSQPGINLKGKTQEINIQSVMGDMIYIRVSKIKIIHPGFKKTADGLYYKFYHKSGNTTQPRLTEYAVVEMVYGTPDSVLFDSRNLPASQRPMKIPIIKSIYKGDIYEGLEMMHVGDSAVFLSNTNSVFIKLFRMQKVPKFANSAKNIYFSIKLLGVRTTRQIEAEKSTRIMKLQNAEAKEREAYLKKNNITVKPTQDGLYFIPEKAGKGPHPQKGDKVSVHYTGYLLNGKKFDSSRDRGKPFEFTLGKHQVIAGWDEGVAMLRKGGSAKLIIPSSLGYGTRNMGPIPPSSTLVFNVELVNIQKGKK